MINTVYIEKRIINHPRTKKILSRFKKKINIITCDHYGEIFNIKSQNFRIQKKEPALIIAKKEGKKILQVPKNFGIGGDHNYYFSHMLNCIYDCEYCFLQGKHMSAHYLLFVNYEDFLSEIKNKIKDNKFHKTYFFSGYDCDSLALDGITGFVDNFLPIFKKNKNGILELRTKSTQINSILKHKPINNCILAFSFTPDKISRKIEHKTPSVKKRIKAIKELADKGWKIGLRFDPIIPTLNFNNDYEELIKDIASSIPKKNLHSISFGMMRFPKKIFKKINKELTSKEIYKFPITKRNNLFSYPKELENKLSEFIYKTIKKNLGKVPIYNCRI